MKKDWKSPRSRQQVESRIPASYQKKDPETQARRELTFLLQESAFSTHIPIYCLIDIDLLDPEEARLFTSAGMYFQPRAAIILGQNIREEFLFAEQDVPGVSGTRPVTAAQLIAENYLMGFQEKLEMQGYRAEIIPPQAIPDPKLAAMMACSGKGYAGRNGRFLDPDYGCQISAGVLLTDAPLMGDDYRFENVDPEQDPCSDCHVCRGVCPAGALGQNGFDLEKCMSYRDDPAHYEQAGAHTRLKCMACMTACPFGR